MPSLFSGNDLNVTIKFMREPRARGGNRPICTRLSSFMDFDVGKDLTDIVLLTLIVDRMTEDAIESNAHCAMLR